MKLTITLRSEDFSKLILLSVATKSSYDEIVGILIAHYAPQEPSCDLECHRRPVTNGWKPWDLSPQVIICQWCGGAKGTYRKHRLVRCDDCVPRKKTYP